MPVPAAIVGVGLFVGCVFKKKRDLNKKREKLVKFIRYFKRSTENLNKNYKEVNETYLIHTKGDKNFREKFEVLTWQLAMADSKEQECVTYELFSDHD